MKINPIDSSFRDPMGRVFVKDNQLYRSIAPSYQEQYDLLINSGFYQALQEQKLLIPHEEIDDDFELSPSPYKVIKPEFLPYISYPYEWSFSQFKDAALLSLKIARLALDYGLVLKDASAYNVQFKEGKPIFIDSLSFEKYREGEAWVAYQQFCRHFLAPLALMTYYDPGLNQLLQLHLDGIPLPLCARLLPFKSRFKIPLLLHIHMHAKSIKQHEATQTKGKSPRKFSLQSFKALLDNLETGIQQLKFKLPPGHWGVYYEDHILNNQYLQNKENLVKDWLEKQRPTYLWDLGANDGRFSRLASNTAFCIAFDFDPHAVEYNYLQLRKSGNTNLLPLRIDLSNPSPGIGWNNKERDAFKNRPKPDLILVLALIHHLAITNQIPLKMIAEFLAQFEADLILEFIPSSDPKAQLLIKGRDVQFENYTQENLEIAFSSYFDFEKATPIEQSKRILYSMKFRSNEG